MGDTSGCEHGRGNMQGCIECEEAAMIIAELEAERDAALDAEDALNELNRRLSAEKDALRAEVARLREALRSVNGAVGHAIAEHLRDPHRAVYEEGDFDRRLLKMSEAVQRIARDALAEAEEGE